MKQAPGHCCCGGGGASLSCGSCPIPTSATLTLQVTNPDETTYTVTLTYDDVGVIDQGGPFGGTGQGWYGCRIYPDGFRRRDCLFGPINSPQPVMFGFIPDPEIPFSNFPCVLISSSIKGQLTDCDGFGISFACLAPVGAPYGCESYLDACYGDGLYGGGIGVLALMNPTSCSPLVIEGTTAQGFSFRITGST